MDAFLAIASRRDERRYRPDPLPGDVVARILDAGRLSGSGSNRQPWTFVIPTSRERLEQVAEGVYEPGNIHADTESCFRILADSDFGFIHQVLVYRGSHAGSVSSWNRKMNSYAPAAILDLVRHGPRYLEPGELAAQLDLRLGYYYAFLAKSVWMKRDREYWDYHAAARRKAGRPISRLRIAAAMLRNWLRMK